MDDSIWLAAPPGPPAPAVVEFAALLARIESGLEPVDTYDLRWPVSQFLMYVASTGRFAFHGTGPEPMFALEPRRSNDTDEFGNRRGVYAAADGLWPMYFAVVDRRRVASLLNACFSVHSLDGDYQSGPWYFFSVDSAEPAPWRDGAVYLLPIAGFERQEDLVRGRQRIRTSQLFSPHAVRPVARLPVSAQDFPLLGDIRRHDSAVVQARAAADPDGFPWLDTGTTSP